jgi:hypothetical protein
MVACRLGILLTYWLGREGGASRHEVTRAVLLAGGEELACAAKPCGQARLGLGAVEPHVYQSPADRADGPLGYVKACDSDSTRSLHARP